jgi:cobalt/nickel transport system permease protein
MAEQSFAVHRHHHGGFIEDVLGALMAVLEHALVAERLAQSPGLLQGFDPRVRLISLFFLIGLTVAVHQLSAVLLLFGLALLLAIASHLPIRLLARGIWPSVLFFTGLIALPALFMVPGNSLLQLPWLGWHLSQQGLNSAALLLGRALTSTTFAALLILSTPWPQLLKALRVLGVPAVLVLILAMTYRYLFVLIHSALEMFVARQSRQVGRMPRRDQRQSMIAGLGVLFGKSLQMANEVFMAMQSRGYRGEHHCLLEFHLQTRDWLALSLLPLATIALMTC